VDEQNNVVAIKDDTAGNYGRRLAITVNGKLPLLSGGRKENHLDIHFYGVDGYLSVYMSFKPKIAHKYWGLIKLEQFKRAAQIVNKYDISLLNFSQKMNLDFDAVIHGAMEVFGITTRWRRSPYYNLKDQEIEQLKDFFQKIELL